MRLNPKQLAQALYEAVSQVKPAEQEKVLDRFVKVLAEEGALNLWPDIEKELIVLFGKASGKEAAELVTAKEEIKINAGLIETLNSVAKKKLDINRSVDEELIGGVVLKTDDLIFDASIKTQLSKLKSELSK